MELNKDFLQLVAACTVMIIGLAFILGGRLKKNSSYVAVPYAPPSTDFVAIKGSIRASTTIDQLNGLYSVCDNFFDLHYSRIEREQLKRYYADLIAAIAKRKSEIYAQLSKAGSTTAIHGAAS